MIGLSEFVEHNVNGIIVEDNDLFISTVRLMQDKELLSKMSKQSKKKYLKLSKKDPLLKWENIFNK